MDRETLDELRGLAARLMEGIVSLSAAEPAVRLLTFAQAAEALAVGRTTVQELVDCGQLPVVAVTGRAVRIDARDVEAFVKRRRERRSSSPSRHAAEGREWAERSPAVGRQETPHAAGTVRAQGRIRTATGARFRGRTGW
jgi:excisionase family DNA binding protein